MARFTSDGARPLGGGTLAPIGSLTDTDLARTLDNYRNAVAGRYFSVASADIASRIGGGPWWVSTKLDGELWYLCRLDDESLLVAPNGRVISGDIDILTAAATLPPGCILAGELHVVASGRRGRVGDVGLALTGGSPPGPLAFAAFDVVSAEGISALSPYADRLTFLAEHVPADGALRLATTADAESTGAIADAYGSIVAEGGAEGIVVRSSDGRTYKVKPTTEIDAVNVAYTERKAESGGFEIRSILVALAHPDGGWVPLTSVANLGDSKSRTALHEKLVAIQRPSAYRHAGDSVMYRFVEPSIVVEVRLTDMQAEDSRGRHIREPRLEFDATAGWRAVAQVDAVSTLSPVLQRVRDDKLPTLRDAGWEQVEPFLTVPDPDAAGEYAASEVIRRQVWVKHSGEKTDVRKLLVWKTNKDATGKYPAYVVHWTDYSSTRKSPLNREVRLAPNAEEATRLADAMVVDNVKKGWEEVS